MGVAGTDGLGLMSTYIPLSPVNCSPINKSYLIIHSPVEMNKSHMSIIIDLGDHSRLSLLVRLIFISLLIADFHL